MHTHMPTPPFQSGQASNILPSLYMKNGKTDKSKSDVWHERQTN